jgi:hypothetical protein
MMPFQQPFWSPGFGMANVIFFGFVCWALVEHYPHPEEDGIIAFTVLMVLIPILSLVELFRSGPSGWLGLHMRRKALESQPLSTPTVPRALVREEEVMTKCVFALITVAAIAGLGTACSFEQKSTPTTPTSTSTAPSNPASPAYTGSWTSVTGAAPSGSPTSCGNFQWRVTSQTATSIAGDFSAMCGSYTVTGTGSGQLNGSAVTVAVSGSGTVPGLFACAFSLNGAGTVSGDTLPLTYTGTTCFGPVHGTETLKRSSSAAVNAPVTVSPVNGVTTASTQPTLQVTNATTSGPVGAISYQFEVSQDYLFASGVVSGTVAEQSNQTSYTPPSALAIGAVYFWRAQASDGQHTSPWTQTQNFITPSPTAPPPPPSGGHVTPGPLTAQQASNIVYATAKEFPHLTAVFGSEAEAVNAAEELLLRTIWHLQHAGFQAGRQRNPSGAISNDKLTIVIDGAWHSYDVYSLGYAGRATTVQFIEVWPADPLPSSGIQD